MDRLSTIKKKKEFTELFQSGTVFHERHIIAYVAPEPLPAVRYGVCVGKKIGCAVERNRIRRRLREIVRHDAPFMKTGFRFLVIARSACKNAFFDRIREEFRSICARASIAPDTSSPDCPGRCSDAPAHRTGS